MEHALRFEKKQLGQKVLLITFLTTIHHDISSNSAQGRCGSIHASTNMMTVMQPSKAEQQNQRTKRKVGADICFFFFFSLQIAVRSCKKTAFVFPEAD